MPWPVVERYRELLTQERPLACLPQRGDISFGLVFPNIYHVGMSNLGYHIIYQQLKTNPRIWCDRIFLPEIEYIEQLEKQRKPLFSLESRYPINRFDILGFSISFELDYLNVLKILRLGHIPLYAQERTAEYPLIVAGGAAIFINPEPLALFIDVFVLGEGEEKIHELIDIFFVYRNKGKQELLRFLGRKKGFYVPSLYVAAYNRDKDYSRLEPVDSEVSFPLSRIIVKDIDLYDGHSVILTPFTEFSNTYLIEVMRGCPYQCYFCTVSACYKPFRKRRVERLVQQIREGIGITRRLGLVGATLGDYHQIRELAAFLSSEKVEISATSLRADQLPVELIELLVGSGQKKITLAPEAGNERLRFSLNKKLTDAEIYEAVALITQKGIHNIKLYFLIGLPGEKEEDILDIVRMIKKISQIQKENGCPNPLLSVTVNPFIPKPFSPWERKPMEREEILTKRINLLKERLKHDRVKLNVESLRWSFIQALIARGNRVLGPIMIDILEKGNSFSNWHEALHKRGLTLDYYLHSPSDQCSLFSENIGGIECAGRN